MTETDFPGADISTAAQGYIAPDLPDRIRLVDSEKFVSVDLHKMILAGDGGTRILKLTERSRGLQPQTALSLQYVALHSLNGRRKVGTVVRWLNEFNLFLQTIRANVTVSIATITFKMYNSYVVTKNASQHKLLRSFLLYWASTKQPGISEELMHYLTISSPPEPRSQITIQNAVPHERPFNVSETRQILAAVDRLFISQVFDAQDNLLWRLIIAEGMRPTQLRLLMVGDVTLNPAQGASATVLLRVPCIKQHGSSGRNHMMETSMPNSVGVALRLQLAFLERVLGHPPAKTSPMFAVSHTSNGQPAVRGPAISIDERIVLTRPRISDIVPFLDNHDLFTRRFKHTKLTHLAILGAPLEVLARAGYQTSTISLRHYVNLSEEAFVDYEERMTSEHAVISGAFSGSLISAGEATNPDLEHKIFDLNLNEPVGSCATDPCDVFAPVGCYTCPRFEAFTDGAHGTVLNFLTKRKARAQQIGLSAESISRDDASISAVQQVIEAVNKGSNRA
jgi:hypothetical protein